VLASVNKNWGLLMVGLVLVSVTIGFFRTLNTIVAGILFRGADFVAAFDKAQRDALAMLFLQLSSQGNFLDEIFWGLWLFSFGLLVFRSGSLPCFLGVWLMINCFGWLILSPIALLDSAHYEVAFGWAQPALFGELAITLWLLIRGVNTSALSAQSA
jgi:hypothetical protein